MSYWPNEDEEQVRRNLRCRAPAADYRGIKPGTMTSREFGSWFTTEERPPGQWERVEFLRLFYETHQEESPFSEIADC